MTQTNPILVCVYGSLRRGWALHGHLATARHVGDGTVRGFVMYDLGAYPAVVAHSDPRATIRGEVYEVDAATLRRLDRVESEGSLYHRRVVPVRLDSGDVVQAHIYAMRPAMVREMGAWPVHSGDWTAHRLDAGEVQS